MLTKLVTFAPTTHIEKLQEALFAVGGGVTLVITVHAVFRIREQELSKPEKDCRQGTLAK